MNNAQDSKAVVKAVFAGVFRLRRFFALTH